MTPVGPMMTMVAPGESRTRLRPIDARGVQEAAKLISQARRPVILAGQGAMIARADKELLQLAETLGCPVTTTLLGKGVFPETHPLSLGMIGMHGTAYANKAICEADLIFNIGSRFDDRIIGKPHMFGRDAKLIHIDIDAAEFNKMIKVDVTIKGDAKAALTALLPLIQKLPGFAAYNDTTTALLAGLVMFVVPSGSAVGACNVEERLVVPGPLAVVEPDHVREHQRDGQTMRHVVNGRQRIGQRVRGTEHRILNCNSREASADLHLGPGLPIRRIR